MKRILAIITSLFLIGIQSGLAQESDDLYFFKSDRERPQKTALGMPSSSQKPDFSQNQGGEVVVQDKFMNPDFSGNTASSTHQIAYAEEGQLLTTTRDQGWNNINNPNSNAFNNMYANAWNRPNFNMGMGFNNWGGAMTGIGLSWGMGSMFGSPWGWNGGFGSPWAFNNGFNNGFYDPFWGGYGFNSWNRWNNPWCRPWGYNPVVVVVDNTPKREFANARNFTGSRVRNNVPVRNTNVQQRVTQLASRNDRSTYFNRVNSSRNTTGRDFTGRNSTNRSNNNSWFRNTNSRSNSNRSNSSFSFPSNNRSSSRSFGTRSTGTRSTGVRTSGRRGN